MLLAGPAVALLPVDCTQIAIKMVHRLLNATASAELHVEPMSFLYMQLENKAQVDRRVGSLRQIVRHLVPQTTSSKR